mgnify:CR=1 FL=1
MAAICENCGKVSSMGRQHQHKRGVAGKRWLKRTTSTVRSFKVNIQKATVMLAGPSTQAGVKKQMKLCTDCISKFKKTGKIGNRTPLRIATI